MPPTMVCMKYWRASVLLMTPLLLLLTEGSRAECTQLVLAADPAYPPLHWYDGQTLRGASLEIAKRVLEDIGQPYEVRYVGPFTRVMALAEHGEIDMVVTLKKTPEREKFLLFPATPALSNPVAVFAQRNHNFEFRSRQDLVGLRGGMTRGNVFGGGFDEYMNTHLTIETANTPDQNFSKLGAGRIDYFITGYFAGMAFLLKRGEEEKFVALRPFVADTDNFIALTRNGRCADKLPAIEARLAALKKNGVLEDLVRQSLVAWRERPVLR